ncbi:hypothetical protein LCGC14_1634820 [marine sediment metagenome]|uniref:Uncharacterized protein n=1 Tax=marine sediment metagenome TaxID=412755 RepID=A0A0F9L148_9ZZZZ
MSEHTELPWKTVKPFSISCMGDGSAKVIAIQDRLGRNVATTRPTMLPVEQHDNAELIILACNSRKDLLDACKNSLTEMEKWRDEGCCCEPEGHTCGISRLNHSIEQSEAAIEKAKVKQ